MMSTGHHPLSFSVIIPTYNSASTIKLALQSIEQQSYPAHEVIVVDDGSVDDTVQTVEQFRSRSTLNLKLVQQPNKGAGAARNAGIEVAKGDWLLFLDSDDIWKHHRIEKLFKYILQHPEVDFVHTDRDYVAPNGVYKNGSDFPASMMVDRSYLFSGFRIKTSTVGVRRSRLNQYNIRFLESVRTCEDYFLFWAFLLESNRIGYINSADVVIVERNGSLTRDDDFIRMLSDNICVISIIIKSMQKRNGSKELGDCLARLRYRSAQSLLLQTTPFVKRAAFLPVIFKNMTILEGMKAVISTLRPNDKKRRMPVRYGT